GIAKFYGSYKDEKIHFDWKNSSYIKTMANELVRNNLEVWVDFGGDKARGFSGLDLFDKYKLDGKDEWLDLINPFYGHYYPIDHNSELGAYYYTSREKNFLKYFDGTGMSLFAVEIFNELGYAPFSSGALEEFRIYLKSKYKNIGTFNRVCRTSFTQFEEALPPHLWEASYAKNADETQYRKYSSTFNKKVEKMKTEYPELLNDWIEFLRIRLAGGFKDLAGELRKCHTGKVNLTIQARLQQMINCSYSTIDIELLSPYLDIFGHQISNPKFFYYNGNPADYLSVREASCKLTFYPDYVCGIFNKPVYNSECIVEGNFPPGESIDYMLSHAAVNLHTEWKYQVDAQNTGFKSGWHAGSFDDKSWEQVKIPNFANENDHAARKALGLCWYRFKFPMTDKHLRMVKYDFQRFFLAGKGLDDSADIYINGKKIFSGGKWNTVYKIDITDELNYAGENVIAVCINNINGEGGIRDYITIVDSSKLMLKKYMDPGQCHALFWQHVIHGHSGLDFWMVKEPKLNPEIPKIKADIESVSSIILPRPRIKGKIAILYPFESFYGLGGLVEVTEEFSGFMELYNGFLFNHVPPDVISCRSIIEGKHFKYPLLVLPYAKMVRKGVFEKVMEYADKGGKIIITRGSLITDDYYYEKLPVEKLLSKAGVYFLKEPPGFDETYKFVSKIIAENKIKRELILDFEKSQEFPFIEAQIIGNENKFIVYLMNWGGLEHKCNIKINPDFIKNKNFTYKARYLQERKNLGKGIFTVPELEQGIPGTIKVQEPMVFVFESETTAPVQFKNASPKRVEIIKALAEKQKPLEFTEGFPSVLFMTCTENEIGDLGKEGSPVLVDLLEKNGCRVYERTGTEITPEFMKKIDVLFILEDYVYIWKMIESENKNIYNIFHDYLENGGSIFVAGIINVGGNNVSLAMRKLVGGHKINPMMQTTKEPAWFYNKQSCQYNDPMQVIFTDIRAHEITSGIKSFHAFSAVPLIDQNKMLVPIIVSGKDDLFPEMPVLLSGEIGKGRIVVSGETFFMQPFNIEKGDNLQLAWNIMAWL
ncbi:MAG TPA: hypothetical protein DC049_11490, partial [Spirochaetia bacterium]|nr:hypothetical protein [Spirochaetia bacterium]